MSDAVEWHVPMRMVYRHPSVPSPENAVEMAGIVVEATNQAQNWVASINKTSGEQGWCFYVEVTGPPIREES